MKNNRGYLLLESVISLSIIMILSLSLYSILLFTTNYKETVEDRVELYEQGEEIEIQVNRLIENSKGIISINNLVINGSSPYIDVESIKCRYKDENNIKVKDRELSFKRNKKLFINTLNNGGNSEVGGYEIGDYVDYIGVKVDNNKITIRLRLSKNDEKYEKVFYSYIREF